MHLIVLFIVAAGTWMVTAKLRGKTTGSAVGLGILGGMLAVIVSFCLYMWIPGGFQGDMLRRMPDAQYVILFEALPALMGSVVVGVLSIPKSKREDGVVKSNRVWDWELIGLILLICIGVAAIYTIIVVLTSSSSSSPWDFIATTRLAANLVMLVAVFRLFPDTHSSWRAAFRWLYTAHFALCLVPVALIVPLSYMQFATRISYALQTTLYFGAAVSLVVLAIPVSRPKETQDGGEPTV